MIRIILFFILVVATGFGVMPWREEIAQLQQQIQLKERERDATVKEFEKIKKAEALTTDNPEEMLGLIPRTREQETIIREIESVAGRTGYKVTQMSFNKRRDKDLRAGVLNASVILEGNKKNLGLFLLGVEQNARFMKVDNINLKANNRETPNKGVVSLAITAYYQND